MTRRTGRQFPGPPADWDQSSRETWNTLIRVLESSELFDQGRRTRPAFIIKGAVSAPVTLDLSAPEVTALSHIVSKLLNSLNRSPYVDVR